MNQIRQAASANGYGKNPSPIRRRVAGQTEFRTRSGKSTAATDEPDGGMISQRPHCYNPLMLARPPEKKPAHQNRGKETEMATEPATPGMDRIRLETAQDFIDALQQHPKFQEAVLRHLLTGELLGLPEQVKQLRDEFVEHRKEFLEHRKEFIELRNEFIEHRKEFQEYARRTNQELARLGGAVGQLQGTDYENHAAHYVPRRLRTVLGLSRPAAIATPRDKSGLHAIADEAAEKGLITDEEADDLLLADAAFAAVDAEGNPVHIAIEASITAQTKDCDRAVRRAGIMSRATGITAIPVVISVKEEDGLAEERRHEVTFFNVPYKD